MKGLRVRKETEQMKLFQRTEKNPETAERTGQKTEAPVRTVQ